MNPAMKKILFATMIVLAGISITGCDSLLDTVPKDRLTKDTFFKSENELKAFAIVFYGAFPGSDLYIANDDHYTQNKLSEEETGTRIVPSSSSDAGWNWGALRNINTLLENLGNCPDVSTRTKYEALARFFRAYFYYNKVKRFGDVPWYDRNVGSTETELLRRPRDNREFIMGKILEDIDFAIANLPTEKSVYEVTKWTAMALKSQICLFEGTFRKYHAGDVFLSTLPADAKDYNWYLTECAKVSKDFIQTSGYGLHPSYWELFHTLNATELSDEVILARNYNKDYSVSHASGATMTNGSRGCPAATKKLVASFLMKDGTRFTDIAGWDKMDFVQETQNRDSRLSSSIRTPGYKRMGETATTSPDFKVSFSGYHPDKYVTTTGDQDIASDIDLIVFRCAEVYLNYAEALAEAGTLTQADLDMSVNLLRKRAGVTAGISLADANADPDPFLTDPAWGGYQSPVLLADANKGVILEIRRERAVELCQEGFRYYDLMRWKEGKLFSGEFYGMYFPAEGVYDVDANGTKDLEIYSTASTGGADTAKKLDDEIYLSGGTSGLVWLHKGTLRSWDENRDYLYPIPKNERNLTGGALSQNPGWDDGLTF